MKSKSLPQTTFKNPELTKITLEIKATFTGNLIVRQERVFFNQRKDIVRVPRAHRTPSGLIANSAKT